jgi:uncharacterized protein YdhG (YjbR/CyaY superfamily)
MYLEPLTRRRAIERNGGHVAMKSEATTVEGYLADVPEERRQALETLRTLCLDELAGYEEGMQYGMPSYSRDGTAVEVAFASQKNYISLYVMRESVIKANTNLLDGLSVGKGCIRFKRPEQIDPTVVRPLLSGAAADTGPIY